jgi:hypothetical protein
LNDDKQSSELDSFQAGIKILSFKN